MFFFEMSIFLFAFTFSLIKKIRFDQLLAVFALFRCQHMQMDKNQGISNPSAISC